MMDAHAKLISLLINVIELKKAHFSARHIYMSYDYQSLILMISPAFGIQVYHHYITLLYKPWINEHIYIMYYMITVSNNK